MPWKEAIAMSLRLEFVQLALRDGANLSQLCRDFGICRKTGRKWLQRFRESGSFPGSLADRSRRPKPRGSRPDFTENLPSTPSLSAS